MFTWSASGQIFTESLASDFVTRLLYIIHLLRIASCSTYTKSPILPCYDDCTTRPN